MDTGERPVRPARLCAALLGLIGALALVLGAATATAKADLLSHFDAYPSSTQAGAYADSTTEFMLTDFQNHPVDTLKFHLPPGLMGTLGNFATCELIDFTNAGCPTTTQVGTASVTLNVGSETAPMLVPLQGTVHALVNGRGEAARFGIRVFTLAKVILSIKVRPDDFGLDATVESMQNIVAGTDLTLWGVPWDHWDTATKNRNPRLPFMANPSTCGEEAVTTLEVNSYATPSVWESYSATSPALVGCEDQVFEPTISAEFDRPFVGAASGLEFGIDIPYNTDPDGLQTPPLRDVKVTLPEGVSINPSLANGLDACSDAEFGEGSMTRSTCPVSSRIGTVEFEVPALQNPRVAGTVYVGEPQLDDTYRLFLEAYGSSVRVKLKGSVRPDPVTGQLTTMFENNPETPVSSVKLSLKGGPRAALVMPDTCGVKTVSATITSWGGQSAQPTATFEVGQDAAGSPCRAQSFDPRFVSGVEDPGAGGSSPFTLAVSRDADSKQLRSLQSIELPEGLLGNVGSVPLCDAAQAQAGNCGEESRVGSVQVAAGAGIAPVWLPQAGKAPTSVYLTGPYAGAPYGLSIVVPAQVGPYDLGRVVVMSALHVDERTIQLTTGIDASRIYRADGSLEQEIQGAMPTILNGIPLNLRDLRVIVDREGFMVNPTDCSPQRIGAEIFSVNDDRAAVATRFRAAECAKLGFAPRFRARILNKGRRSTLRSFHPRTRFTVVPRKGDANIGAARVVLPSSTLLDQANIGTTCTRAQMTARDCPEASVVGHAKAWSPLLKRSVQGPVYLAANGGVRPLPDLAAVMDGELRVVLQGEISTLRGGGKARLQNTFRVVPDAPVSRFALTMRGGQKRGLLVNSTDLCRTKERGVAVFRGQNGRVQRLRPRIATAFKGCAKVRRQAARR